MVAVPNRRSVPTLVVALTLAFASCEGASEVCDPTDPLCGSPTPVPTTVTVSPPDVTFSAIGETQQLTASVLDQSGNAITNPPLIWSSDNESVATVSPAGLVTAQGSGVTSIEATAGTATGSAGVSVGDPCEPRGMLAFLDVTSGTLSDRGCVISGGGFGDPWRLTIEAADAGTVQIDLLSSDFDAYVYLLDASLTIIAQNDDAHFTGAAAYDASSHLVENLSAGTYTIFVTSAGGDETGEYDLHVGPGLICPEVGSIGVGGAVFGSLANTDCSYAGGFYADAYVVEVTSGDELTFSLDSPDFDAYLALLGPAGHFLLDDDDSGGGPDGTNSLFNASLAPGWYVVHVTSFSTGEIGDYSLSIQP
jgi:hypothetical protein